MLRRFWRKIIYRFIPFCFSYPFFKIFGRLEIKGINNIPITGSILIAANHLSYIDPPLLATIIPGGCIFMAKHDLFNIPVLRHIIGYYAFPVNRQKPSVSAIKTAVSMLDEGKIVVIFPEGSRGMGSDFLPFKNGIGMISVLSKRNVIPALIEGSDKFLPPNKILPKPNKIRITFGKPLDLSQEDTDYTRISHKIMDSIKNMKDLKQ